MTDNLYMYCLLKIANKLEMAVQELLVCLTPLTYCVYAGLHATDYYWCIQNKL